MEEEGSSIDVREYLAILRRHGVQIIGVTSVLAAVAIAVAVGLPPVYRSTARILVQEQEIPTDLVRSTVTSFADERIQVISQQVMTRAVLLELIDKYRLYEKYRNRKTRDEIVERMRKDITLTTVDANISDRSSGRRVNATIAFDISYDAPHPDQAQNVASELVSLYLHENQKARQQSAAETTAFLTQEADRLEKQIQETEASLAQFKRKYAGRTPESTAMNMQLAERTEAEMLRIDREMSMLQDRRSSLEMQLTIVKPNLPVPTSSTGPTANEPVLGPAERLKLLQSQYISASGRYRPDHPDIRRLQREITALESEIGSSGGERGNAGNGKEGSATVREGLTADPSKPDNPAYVALISQLETTKRELGHLAALKEDLRAKQRSYDTRLLQIPEIEREYRDLTRDYENAQARYRDVRSKQMQAQVAQELEKDRKAERFTLSEPATLPEKPASPNRLRIVAIGVVASLGSGIGLAWLRDFLNPSVKGPSELARIARVPTLTAIPYIETRRERRVKRRRTLMELLGYVVLGATLLAGVHFALRLL